LAGGGELGWNRIFIGAASFYILLRGPIHPSFRAGSLFRYDPGNPAKYAMMFS
jgi:hypothetical protein